MLKLNFFFNNQSLVSLFPANFMVSRYVTTILVFEDNPRIVRRNRGIIDGSSFVGQSAVYIKFNKGPRTSPSYTSGFIFDFFNDVKLHYFIMNLLKMIYDWRHSWTAFV